MTVPALPSWPFLCCLAQATPCALAILRDRNCCSEGREKTESQKERYTEGYRSKGGHSRVLGHLGYLGLPHPVSRHSLHSHAACWLQAARGVPNFPGALPRVPRELSTAHRKSPPLLHRSQEAKAKHHVDQEYQSSLAPFTEPPGTSSLPPALLLPPSPLFLTCPPRVRRLITHHRTLRMTGSNYVELCWALPQREATDGSAGPRCCPSHPLSMPQPPGWHL